MPRRKLEIPEDESKVIEVAPSSEDDTDLERVLSEVGTSAKYIALSRFDSQAKKWAYVEKISIEDFDLESVKTEYGGGNYRGRVYGESGYIRHISFVIDSRFMPRPVLPPTAALSNSNPPAEGLGEIKDLLKTLVAMQLQPRTDPMDMAIRLAEVLRGSGASVVAPATPMGFSEMFSIFKEGMSLGQAASGGEASYLPVIEKVGLPLVEAIKSFSKNPPSQPILNKVNGGPPLNAPTPQTPEQYLQSSLPKIVALASAKKDPHLYADVVLDQLPESAYDYLFSVSQRPDCVSFLSSLNPGVKEHEAWFLEFVSAIKDALTPEEEPSASDNSEAQESLNE